MKKFYWNRAAQLIVLFCCVVCLCGIADAGHREIAEVSGFDIVIFGEALPAETSMLSVGSTWFLPLRVAAGKLGLDNEMIRWNSAYKSVAFEGNGQNIELMADENTATVGSGIIELDKAPLIHNGVFYVPLDFFEKVFGCLSLWDEGSGRLYIQKKETFDRIYELLGGSVVCDPHKENKLLYEYTDHTEMIDAENGFSIEYEAISGKVEYSFKTDTCIDRGVHTLLGRDFEFENRCENGVLYTVKHGETTRNNNKERVKGFLESMLGNAYLYRSSKEIKAMSPASDEADDGYSLSPLEKLAAVLNIKDNKSNGAVEISGSILGIQKVLRQAGVLSYDAVYVIDTRSGRLTAAGQERTTRDVKYGVAVNYVSAWHCKYKVK